MSDPQDVIHDADEELAKADQVLESAGKLLSVAVAARRLDVCTATVRRWIQSGKMPAIRYPNGHLRVSSRVIENIQSTVAYSRIHST